jgi:single-strand DNA-binding protein
MSGFTINRVVLVGRLTRDPELRKLPSGSSVCGLRIACNSVRRDSEGEYYEKPNFFDVDVYDTQGENVEKYTSKGQRVAIDGRLDWREWESPNQEKRQAVSIVADTVMFLEGPSERGESGSGNGGPAEGIDREVDYEVDQGALGNLGLRPASELVGAGGDAEDEEVVSAGGGVEEEEMSY